MLLPPGTHVLIPFPTSACMAKLDLIELISPALLTLIAEISFWTAVLQRPAARQENHAIEFCSP